MHHDRKFLICAILGYVGMILFVYFHPIGRHIDFFDFKSHKPETITAMFCMVATAAAYVAGSRDKTGSNAKSRGCLGMIVAFFAVFAVVFIGITPKSWTKIESEQFIRNLMDVTMLPFVFVFIAGQWQSRRSR